MKNYVSTDVEQKCFRPFEKKKETVTIEMESANQVSIILRLFWNREIWSVNYWIIICEYNVIRRMLICVSLNRIPKLENSATSFNERIPKNILHNISFHIIQKLEFSSIFM